MSEETWQQQFKEVYSRALQAYRSGRQRPDNLFNQEDLAFLGSIGCSAQELFDYIDDFQRFGEPDPETVLAVQAIRRKYFLEVMNGQPSGKTVSQATLPGKSEALDGITWLPRIIAKARLKLRGEMPPEIMFGCGGDRPFLRSVHMSAPEFLQLVWDSGDDEQAIANAVKHAALV